MPLCNKIIGRRVYHFDDRCKVNIRNNGRKTTLNAAFYLCFCLNYICIIWTVRLHFIWCVNDTLSCHQTERVKWLPISLVPLKKITLQKKESSKFLVISVSTTPGWQLFTEMLVPFNRLVIQCICIICSGVKCIQ